MFNKLFKKDKEEFNEAYLKLDKDKVIEQEKKRRRELGETIDEEPTYEYVVTNVNEDVTQEDEVEDTKDTIEDGEDVYDLTSSKENPVYRSWKSWLFVLFMPAFIFSGVHLYKDHMSRVLNTEFDYAFFRDSGTLQEDQSSGENDSVAVKEEIVKEEIKEKENDSADVDMVTPSENTDIARLDETLTDKLNNNKVDDIAHYSEVHRDLVFTTESIREVVQDYITGTTRHVNMASVGSKSRVKMQTLTIKMNRLPDGDMKELLIKRSERILSMANELSALSKDDAVARVNTFIDEENKDSKDFIKRLIEELEEDGREYSLDGDLIKFN